MPFGKFSAFGLAACLSLDNNTSNRANGQFTTKTTDNLRDTHTRTYIHGEKTPTI